MINLDDLTDFGKLINEAKEKYYEARRTLPSLKPEETTLEVVNSISQVLHDSFAQLELYYWILQRQTKEMECIETLKQMKDACWN